MLTRPFFFSLFSLVLSAQQNTVNFEIHTTNFPKDWSFQFEGLKLKYSAIDTKKMLSEGRNTPTKKDYLLEQESTNKYSWDVFCDENGSPVIKGSPGSVTFDFPKTISKISNANNGITLEGKMAQLMHGTKVADIPLTRRASFELGATYVLLVKYDSLPNGKNALKVAFINKDNLQKELEAKPPDIDLDALRSNPGVKIEQKTITIDKNIMK